VRIGEQRPAMTVAGKEVRPCGWSPLLK